MNSKDMLSALWWSGLFVLIINEIHNVFGDDELRDEIRDLKRRVKKLEDKK